MFVTWPRWKGEGENYAEGRERPGARLFCLLIRVLSSKTAFAQGNIEKVHNYCHYYVSLTGTITVHGVDLSFGKLM